MGKNSKQHSQAVGYIYTAKRFL